jgi:hypothetical protein
MNKPTKIVSDPERWMESGITACGKARQAFQLTLGQMVTAGYYFMRARAALDRQTNVADFFAHFKARISPATIYRYIELTERVFADCAVKAPALAGNDAKLFAAAQKMRLESPREFVAVCRAEKLMRPFGEYDSVKHAQKKLKGPAQMEFVFDVVVESARVLRNFDLDTFFATMPENADATEQIKLMIADCRASEAKLEGWLNNHLADAGGAA